MAKNQKNIIKRIVIKQELVDLTGDFIDAAILGQLLYWTERTKDFVVEKRANFFQQVFCVMLQLLVAKVLRLHPIPAMYRNLDFPLLENLM